MMQMIDSLHGFLRYDHYPEPRKFVHTVDGGHTWVDQGPLALSNRYFFVNADTGFCDVGPDLYKTMDAGINWSKIVLPADPDTSTPEIESYGLFNIFFVDDFHGWMCAIHGFTRTYIFYTDDGGNGWQVISDLSGAILRFNFCDTIHGCFITEPEFHRYAWSTSDNFLTRQLIMYDDYVNAIYAQNDSTTMIAYMDQNMILRITDSGQSFDTLVPEGFENTPFTIWDFKFFGSTGYAYGSYIFKYIDTLNTTLHQIPAAENKINLYPNPSSGNINLTLISQKSETMQLRIYNTDGRCVWKKSENMLAGENKFHYSLDRLKPGVYIMEIAGTRYITSEKFILRR